MPTTPRGYETPTGSDIPDLPYWLQRLAESVDVDVTAVLSRLPVRVAVGTVDHTTTAGVVNTVNITYPAGRFTQQPVLLPVLATAPGNSGKIVPRWNQNIGDDTSGAILLYHGDGTSLTAGVELTIAWVAVQMTEDSAVG